MTNEEKAKAIIRKCREYVFSSRDYDIEQCLLEMAEWKEQQMIDKACEWLELHMQCGVHPQNVSSTIKQFKKAMEE